MWVKQPWYVDNHPPPSNDQLKDEWSCNSIPAISLHSMDMYKFTITILLTIEAIKFYSYSSSESTI